MFAKLLKYYIKSVGKVGIPSVIVILIGGFIGFLLSAVFSTLMYFMTDVIIWNINVYEQNLSGYILVASDIILTLYMIAVFASFFALFAVIIFITFGGTVILVITVVNFYKTLITDEGYLTFTLPVSPTTILCSKLTNSVIWNIIMTLAQIVAGLGMATPFVAISIIDEIVNPTPGVEAAKPTVFEIISDILSALGGIGSAITTIIFVLVMIIVTQLLYFFAVFLGGVIAKKHKLLLAAGFVILAHVMFTSVQQGIQFFVTAVVAVLGSLVGVVAIFLEGLLKIDGFYVISSSVTTIITPASNIINILIFGAIAVVLFFLTNYLMNKKLNLQ